MVVNILNSISSSIKRMGQENNQFKIAATQQNSSISKFIKDVSKLFGSQSKQQSDINNSLNDLQQTSSMTSSKVDQTNNLLQESISIQTNMLSELKNVSTALSGLLGANGQSDGSFFNSLKTFAGGAALGAGVFGASEVMASNIPGLMGSMNGETTGADSLSVKQMVNLAKEAGFTEEQAVVMGAIGAAESSGRPNAYNPNANTGDNSYGLWQINMLGDMGPERRQQFGISSNEELFDPLTNAMAAKAIFDQQGFNAWSVYKSGDYSKFIGTAQNSLMEKDDSMAPPGTTVEKAPASSKVGVLEQQESLAGIRKQPISPKLKTVLERASAAAGVETVIYSGGQAPAGSGGARTGSTRHDHGNAADLKLRKDGRILSDTNPEDRAIMAKFVSAAVEAGATGVGAGHNYMGPESIHVGFGKQAVWGGAPWIKAAASGVYNNEDLTSEGTAYAQNSGGNDIFSQDVSSALAGTPLASFSGLAGELMGAMGIMSGGIPAISSAMSGGMPSSNVGGILNSVVGAMPSPVQQIMSGIEDTGDILNNIVQSNEPAAAKNIQSAAINSELTRNYSNQSENSGQQTSLQNQQPVNNADNQRSGVSSVSSYSSSHSWYLQLAGRISNDETMKFRGGVFA